MKKKATSSAKKTTSPAKKPAPSTKTAKAEASKKTIEKRAEAVTPIKPVAPHRGLGRGLSALIDAPAIQRQGVPVIPKPAAPVVPQIPVVNERIEGSVLTVPVTEIERSPWQPRQTFDDAALHELADSIKANGIIQPLVCRKLENGRFELIGGERRLRASILAGLTRVPLILVEAEDRKAAEMAIVENIQRADLNAIEEAEGYRTLAEKFSLTQSEVAERVGKARPSVANALRLLELPDETKAMVADGRLSAGHAKALLGLARTEDRIRLGRRAVAENLTVRAVERAVMLVNTPPPVRQPAREDLPPEYLRDLTDRLHAFFGTAVRLTSGKTLANGRHLKGVLEVDFYNNDDLDRILTLLGISVD